MSRVKWPRYPQEAKIQNKRQNAFVQIRVSGQVAQNPVYHARYKTWVGRASDQPSTGGARLVDVLLLVLLLLFTLRASRELVRLTLVVFFSLSSFGATGFILRSEG